MSLNRMFDLIEEARDAASWKAAFGEPQVLEGKTIIPVSQVAYGFGLGFGQEAPEAPAEEGTEPAARGEGGGGGGGSFSKPLGVIVVTSDSVTYQPLGDPARVAVTGSLVGALIVWQLTKTLRAIFGK